MRSFLVASAACLLGVGLFAGEAAAQIERLDIPVSRGKQAGRPPRGEGPGGLAGLGPREGLFIAPSGEPFRAPPEAPYPVSTWFARADADHDGRLTFREFTDDSLVFFDSLDANKDGVVDGFEAQVYERTMVPEIAQGSDFSFAPRARASRGLFSRRPPSGSGVAEGAAQYGLLNEPQPVAGADGDLDHKISRAEAIAAAGRRFRRLDTDNDGALTLAALPVTQAQMNAEKRAERRVRDNSPAAKPR
jgi:hypothetical protein